MIGSQNVPLATGVAFFILVGIILVCRHLIRVERAREKKRQLLVQEKNECILNISALLKQQPTRGYRTDPFTIVLWYGTSRIVHVRRSWNDCIMLVYADESYVALHLTNGIIPGITLTNGEEWIIRDIRHALRKWERLPLTKTA